MRLTVIGCSGSLPRADSAASCYLVEAAGFRLLLDLGSGAIGPLQRHLALPDIDAVLLSHLHADHCLDLCGLYVALRYGPGSVPGRTVPVYGPGGTAARLAGAYGPPEGRELADVFAVHEVSDDASWQIGPFAVTARRVTHPVEAYAYRLEHEGRVLAYSGDCAPSAGLDAVAAGADLALVEAAFVAGQDNPPGHHHTGLDAGALATRAGVRRLVVTHVPPWHDPLAAAAAAGEHYGGRVEVAVPGATYEV